MIECCMMRHTVRLSWHGISSCKQIWGHNMLWYLQRRKHSLRIRFQFQEISTKKREIRRIRFISTSRSSWPKRMRKTLKEKKIITHTIKIRPSTSRIFKEYRFQSIWHGHSPFQDESRENRFFPLISFD